MKAAILISLLSASTVVLADKPVFSFCEGDGSQYEYQIDLSQTYTNPSEVVKNCNVELDINGYFNDNVQLSELQLKVYWGGDLLQVIDSPDMESANAYDPFTMKFGVLIPGFVMDGAYYLEARPIGTPEGGSSMELACLKVTFNL